MAVLAPLDLLLHPPERPCRDDCLMGVVLQGEYFAPPLWA
jgi:hypothetical protein